MSTKARRFELRLGDAEADQLAALGRRLGLGRSATVRASIDALDAVTDGRRPSVPLPPSAAEQAALAERVALRKELNQLRGIVNPIARRIHSGDPDAAALVDEFMEQIAGVVDRVSEGARADE
ncbi:hypothetical protein SAMN04488550_2079 [Gordonia malaquae]|uniref:Uncharacterized protein n=2 Tax=Gordonia TaxID=2053 RepID=M3UJ81_GORML|nr:MULTISPECIES: hypothetical protein [Gordonia]GAC79565.1 hypothetical protein GM1_010_01550 [Gordonia malaquae NBRC 108250]GEE02658.1 hypothetical protein nbrc107696_31040 [Gordonia spumicola]SEC59913.1 hypothetical protein SAMN04488550_2079 [Gordonia malaquae]